MLVYEYKLRLSRAQAAAIDEAIRTTQFLRNKALRVWMDGRGVSANDLQLLCSRLAHEYPFAAQLNSQARQAAAARAWAAIARFSTHCREQRPGKKGSPRFQHDCRSVEYQQTGGQLDAAGTRLTRTDGGGIGRVRRLRRADGYYAQFVLQVERRSEHVSTGTALGIDGGSAAYVTDSNGPAVANPRVIRLAETRRQRSPRRLSRRSVLHKQGKKPRNTHAARQRARQHPYPPAAPAIRSSPPPRQPLLLPSASRRTGGRQSSGSGGRIGSSSGSARTSPARRRARSSALTT